MSTTQANSIAYICATCGAQYPPSVQPPAECPICLDARQFVARDGQQWTTPQQLAAKHAPRIEQITAHLYGIGCEPGFGIHQRALLLQTPQANILWDCVPLLDDAMHAAVSELGGVDCIAISHPHFYTTMADWAEAFDARIMLPAVDEAWIMRPHPAIQTWDGETCALTDGVTMIRCGGHFPGASVLHWAADAPGNASGRGLLCVGDTVQVAADRDWASFMYSYPNNIPLPAFAVERIADRLSAWSFDDIYGGWWHQIMTDNAQAKVQRSAHRYVAALAGDFHRTD